MKGWVRAEEAAEARKLASGCAVVSPAMDSVVAAREDDLIPVPLGHFFGLTWR